MTIATDTIYDATGVNAAQLPAGAAAVGAYTTGSAGVPWTAAQLAAHPGAVLIDQTPAPGAWDGLADVQDQETGAVTVAEVPGRARASLAAFHSGARPGQRQPAIYVGARHNATPVVNALEAAGIAGGICLAVAMPGASAAEAQAVIDETAGTPWPIVWAQYAFGTAYDTGLVSRAWLANVSRKPAGTGPGKPPAPPGPWDDPAAYPWAQVAVFATRTDGGLRVLALQGGKWVRVVG